MFFFQIYSKYNTKKKNLTKEERNPYTKQHIIIPGIATRLAFRVPGSAGTAGREPSMETVSWEFVREIKSGDFFFFCKAFWIEAGSEARLASW